MIDGRLKQGLYMWVFVALNIDFYSIDLFFSLFFFFSHH